VFDVLVVIDTNVLVSAFWSRNGNSARIIGLIHNKTVTPCYDYRILIEYEGVLTRDKFGFAEWEIDDLL
jgi:putative PIN family toxin of toxin-antitoxin system